MLHNRVNVFSVAGSAKIGVSIVERVSDPPDIIAELSSSIWLIAALKIGQKPRDHGVCGTEKNSSLGLGVSNVFSLPL